MAVTIQKESDKLLVIRITGLLKKSELDGVQATVAKQLSTESANRINILIIVENFQGWERNADWGDISFYAEHGDKMGKIAIVGDQNRNRPDDVHRSRYPSFADKILSFEPASPAHG
jgi:hypothetical protein